MEGEALTTSWLIKFGILQCVAVKAPASATEEGHAGRYRQRPGKLIAKNWGLNWNVTLQDLGKKSASSWTKQHRHRRRRKKADIEAA
jgi:hypothetical protein